MTKKITKAAAELKRWREPGVQGFLNWVEDVGPMVKMQGKYSPMTLTPEQIEEIAPIFERKPSGEVRYRTCSVCWPRRHSKSTLCVLIALYRFFVWDNQNIKVLANSEKQVQSTTFKLAKTTIQKTPALLSRVGKDNIKANYIRLPALGNSIEAIPLNPDAAAGESTNLILATEYYAGRSASTLSVARPAIADNPDGQVLIDSTTDGPGGPIHKLEQEAEKPESTIYASRIEYADLEDLIEKRPAWISEDAIRTEYATQELPGDFERFWLNNRIESTRNLFALKDIKASMEPYPNGLSLKYLGDMTHGRKFVTGGGLDRAQGFSLHGDNTIWTAIAKVAGEDGEAHYYVLNQAKIPFSHGGTIKKRIAEDDKRYKLNNTAIEKYNAQDIYAWTGDVKIAAEQINASTNEQQAAFTEMHRIVSEGRLHFPRELKELEAELSSFEYEFTGSGKAKFEAAQGHKDDRVYSLAWAIYALRDEELGVYELNSLVCNSHHQHAKLCYLRGGNHIIGCADTCAAHRRVHDMHLQYRRMKVNSELNLPDFFKTKVRLRGCRVRPGI